MTKVRNAEPEMKAAETVCGLFVLDEVYLMRFLVRPSGLPFSRLHPLSFGALCRQILPGDCAFRT